MIDLGLTKIALIGAVALVVIGPEKLPAVARMAGTLWGRAQRYISSVKAEVNREMQMEELNKMHSGFMNATSKINQTVSQSLSEVQQNFTEAGDSLTEAMAEANQAYSGYSDALRVPTDEELAAKRRVTNFFIADLVQTIDRSQDACHVWRCQSRALPSEHW